MDQHTAVDPQVTEEKIIKTYYSRTAGMRFIFPDGFEVYFLGTTGRAILELDARLGWYQIKDGKEIFMAYYKELDKIIGRQAQIFVDDNNPQLEVTPDGALLVVPPVSEKQLLDSNASMQHLNIKESQDNALQPDQDIMAALRAETGRVDAQLISPQDQALAAARARIAARGNTPI